MENTDQHSEMILAVLQEELVGLSITDISRRTGINRNKVSQLAETMQKQGILTGSQKFKSKLYALKNPSAIHTLLDDIPKPSLIIEEQFRIIQINREYSTRYPKNIPLIPGATISDIPHLSSVQIRDQLRQFLQESRDGQKNTFLDDSGIQICTAVRLNLLGEKPGLIIILPGLENKRETHTKSDPLITCADRFLQIFDRITGETHLKEAYTQISRIIHTSFPDEFFFVILVDEPSRTGTIHTLHLPQDIPNPIIEQVHRIISDPDPMAISDVKLLRYKGGEIILIDHITDIFHQESIPEPMNTLLGTSPFPPLSTMGIILDDILIAVIGMGNSLNHAGSTEYSQSLGRISGFFSITGHLFRKTEEINENKKRYQAEYRNIYSLLTKKTSENTIHSAESNLFRQILGTILDNLDIMLLVTSRNGEILYGNQTILNHFMIQKEDLVTSPNINDIFPSELASLLIQLIYERKKGEYTQISTTHEGMESNREEWRWYLSAHPENAISERYIFIGEKTPVSLIPYLICNEPL